MTYPEAVARILGLRGGERVGMRPGLERIEALLDAIGRPERAFTIAQVGGTNGKGSISAMLAAILQASGRRVGLYTSPHLRHYRERIRVDGQPISEADFVDGVDALGTLIARLDVTVFEAGTALALDHFCRSRVDVAVLEVGLGGRLDATTVGRPEVVVLGPIDYEMSDVRVSHSESHAFCHCVSHIRGTKTNGEKADYWVRVTTCFQKANGQWLVGHEHVSMPAAM